MDTRKRKAEGAAEESTAKRGRIDAAKGTVILSEGPPRPSYKRPRARGGSNRRPPSRDSALERLNAAVVDGALWHAGCGEPLGGSGESIGVSFSSAEEYVAAFEPLLHEEARESLRAAWADNCDRGHHWEVALGGVGQAEGGWIGLEVRIRRKLFGKGPPRPAPGSAVVLSTFTPPKRGPMDAVHRLVGAGGPADADRWGGPAGRRGGRRGRGRGQAPAGEPQGVVAGIVGPPTRDGADRVLVQLHPACASHGGEEGAACRAVVGMLRAPRGPWCMTSGGSLITEQRECEALHSLNKIRFLGAILRPEAELVARLDDLPRKWPDEMGQGLHEFITSNYDRAQADAIAMCTAHFATPPEGPPEGEGGRHGRPLPIALIQGPPGTGKTHTVIGILNMWHLVQFQRFYERVVEQYKRDAGDAATAGGDWDNLMGLMKTGEVRRSMRPRILVCAPSNAAIDELLERILKAGFSDSEGGRYCPNAVRVGSEDAPISEAVKAVWSETLVSGYLKMEEAEWDRRYRSFSVRRKSLRDDIAGMEMRLQQSPGQLFAQASGLISALEKKEKLDLELERLEAVQSIVRGMQRPNKEVREELELSYLNSAEMVFTTLSSTSKKIFSKAKRGFETVLIDEAAQANEVAALQPLIHGCSQCVLVGDPQQLPATVLSQRARERQLERSLFERLQLAGAPVKVLTMQYRMHPQIRQFPSAYFYNNRLEDGPDVKNDRFAEFYAHGLLKPYVLFDVETGQHERQTTGSLHNRVEAELAASLFQELRSWLIKRCEELIRQGRPPPPGVTVAVITPYRSQRKCLRDVFIEILGVEVASEVKTMTIDSCQGKQVDVVILSCVRASTRSSGVGFVSDIRRMNVAITRAKRALWILGNCKTLRGSSTWGALIQDAESRGCLIKSASAKELFPHQPQFQPGFVRHTVPQPNQEADEVGSEPGKDNGNGRQRTPSPMKNRLQQGNAVMEAGCKEGASVQQSQHDNGNARPQAQLAVPGDQKGRRTADDAADHGTGAEVNDGGQDQKAASQMSPPCDPRLKLVDIQDRKPVQQVDPPKCSKRAGDTGVTVAMPSVLPGSRAVDPRVRHAGEQHHALNQPRTKPAGPLAAQDVVSAQIEGPPAVPGLQQNPDDIPQKRGSSPSCPPKTPVGVSVSAAVPIQASTAMQMEAVQTTNAPQSLPESQFFPAVAHEDGGIVNQFYEVAVPANVLDSVANLAEAATLPQGFAGSSDAQEPAVPRLGLTEVVQPFFAQAMTTGGDQHVLEHNPNVQAVQQAWGLPESGRPSGAGLLPIGQEPVAHMPRPMMSIMNGHLMHTFSVGRVGQDMQGTVPQMVHADQHWPQAFQGQVATGGDEQAVALMPGHQFSTPPQRGQISTIPNLPSATLQEQSLQSQQLQPPGIFQVRPAQHAGLGNTLPAQLPGIQGRTDMPTLGAHGTPFQPGTRAQQNVMLMCPNQAGAAPVPMGECGGPPGAPRLYERKD